MTSHIRIALYALIIAVVAALGGYGLITRAQGAALTQLLVLILGLAFAIANASGNRLLDVHTRRAAYLLLAGIGAFASDFFGVAPQVVSLWLNIALAIFGMALAILNIDPAEADTYTPRHEDPAPGPQPDGSYVAPPSI